MKIVNGIVPATQFESFSGGMPKPEIPPECLAELPFEQHALILFSRYGSLSRVAREIGCDISRLMELVRTDWWHSELQQLRREEQMLANVQLSRIVNKTLNQIEDRLDNGQIKLDALGREVNVPLSANELVRIFDTVFDKRQLLNGDATAIVADNRRLEKLNDKLSRLGVALRQNALAPDQGPNPGISDVSSQMAA